MVINGHLGNTVVEICCKNERRWDISGRGILTFQLSSEMEQTLHTVKNLKLFLHFCIIGICRKESLFKITYSYLLLVV